MYQESSCRQELRPSVLMKAASGMVSCREASCPEGPAGLLDGYETVASENRAEVVSSSFGTPELYFQQNETSLEAYPQTKTVWMNFES